MASFFGFEITQDKPALVKADPVAEINLTMACAVDGNKRSVVSVRPDDGDTFTLAVLSPGVSDFQKFDLKLTAGNEALEFSTSGATVHVTGYVTLPPEYMLDSDSDSDHEAETSTELARTRHGTARLVENVDSDSDDESFNPDLMFAESSDEDGPDDNEFGVQPLLKRAAPAPAAKQKKRKAAEATAATPVPKRPAPSPSAKPDAVFEAAVVEFLKQNGSSPLSKVGNACKRPAGLSVKLKAFLRQRENLFNIEGDRVGLV